MKTTQTTTDVATASEKKYPLWVWLTVCIMASVLGVATAYAISVPNEREQAFIEYGMLEGEQKQLHEESDQLRSQIEQNSQEWLNIESEQNIMWDVLFR